MTPPRLRMRGVAKSYGATAALRAVDLDVAAGEVHAVLGENGAGKSTLMKVLSGATACDAGRIELDGAPYAPSTPADGRRAGVGMVYQELALAPHLSAMENLLLGVEPTRGPALLRRIDWSAARRRARDSLALVGRADLDPSTPLRALPPAEAQLVEIARHVGSGCRLLVLDEPTSSLGRADAEHLLALVRRLRQAGLAVLYVSHLLEEVRAVADRFTVLRDGAVARCGALADTSDDDLVRAMAGRDVGALYPRSPRPRGEVVLELSHLAGRARPHDASLRLHRGEVFGLAGLVGSGRTELLRAVFGLDPVARGDVRVLALRGAQPPWRRWRQGVGMVSEARAREGLALSASIADNIALPKLELFGRCGLVPRRRVAVAAQRWIDALGIRASSPHQRTGSLSGGNQQRVALARLLHADTDVLLLDEPTRGVDVAARAALYRWIDACAAGTAEALGEPGKPGALDRPGGRPRAVLVASSYLPELLGLCDRIAVMQRGVLGPAVDAASLDEHTLLRLATGAQPSP